MATKAHKKEIDELIEEVETQKATNSMLMQFQMGMDSNISKLSEEQSNIFNLTDAQREFLAKLRLELPVFKFPFNWGIMFLPRNASNSLLRFCVFFNGFEVSIYLDFFNEAGLYGHPPEPYYELYPHSFDEDGTEDTYRIGLKEVQDNPQLLIDLIQEGFDNQLKFAGKANS
jgi:hypothetical protein